MSVDLGYWPTRLKGHVDAMSSLVLGREQLHFGDINLIAIKLCLTTIAAGQVDRKSARPFRCKVDLQFVNNVLMIEPA